MNRKGWVAHLQKSILHDLYVGGMSKMIVRRRTKERKKEKKR